MNSKIFSDLVEFFKRAQNVKSSEIGRTSVVQEIPTAALITGKEKTSLVCQVCYYGKPFKLS